MGTQGQGSETQTERRTNSQKGRRLCESLADIDVEDALIESSRGSQTKLPAQGIVLKTEQELDNALHSHPCLMTAMPTNRKKMIKASKKAPGALLLRKGEVWVMVDSGAGVPGMNVDKNCPQLRHKLRDDSKKIASHGQWRGNSG